MVNFCDWSLIDQTHYCGRHSGRKYDKFKETGLTQIPAQIVKAPMIAEAYCNMECKLMDHRLFGDHTWIVGEVVAITHNSAFSNDLLNDDVDVLFYLGNNTYTSFHKQRKEL